MPVEEIKRLGRSTQGVIVMRLRGDEERVSSLALVYDPEEDDADGSELGDLVEPDGVPLPEDAAEPSDG